MCKYVLCIACHGLHRQLSVASVSSSQDVSWVITSSTSQAVRHLNDMIPTPVEDSIKCSSVCMNEQASVESKPMLECWSWANSCVGEQTGAGPAAS